MHSRFKSIYNSLRSRDDQDTSVSLGG